jgi:hypothetical protein
MYFYRSQSGPAIADPSAFVHHVMHRIGAARSFIARLTCSRSGRRQVSLPVPSLSAIWSGVRLVSSCALFAGNDSGLMPNWVTIEINGPNQFATPEELYPENPFHDF